MDSSSKLTEHFQAGFRAGLREGAPGVQTTPGAPPDCDDCQDTGWLASGGDPSRMARCPCTVKLPEKLRRYEDARRDTLSEATLERIDAAYPNRMLYFHGPTGTGKTWAAVATARDRGHLTWLWWPDWTARHRVIDHDSPADALRQLDALVTAVNLVIDDIGAETASDFGRRLLLRILEPRRDEFGVATILTSNFSLGKLEERYGEDRIPSRIAESAAVIRFDGTDRRLEERR